MIGTIVNTAAICVGTGVGCLLHRHVGQRSKDMLFSVIGLAALVLGVSVALHNMSESRYPVLFIASMTLGGLIGTALNLDGRVQQLSARKAGHGVVQGLLTGCLLYCIGSLSILGPIQSAIHGDNTLLYYNASLDLITSCVLATSFGWAMMWGAVVLFCWQGAIYCAALLLPQIPEGMLTELMIIGGLLLICSALSILRIRQCKTIDLLPSLLFPILFYLLLPLF